MAAGACMLHRRGAAQAAAAPLAEARRRPSSPPQPSPAAVPTWQFAELDLID